MLSTTQQGPWQVKFITGYDDIFRVKQASGDAVADQGQVRDMVEAAPDLLVALINLVKECDAFQGPELRREGSTWKPIMEAADQAIMKAGVLYPPRQSGS